MDYAQEQESLHTGSGIIGAQLARKVSDTATMRISRLIERVQKSGEQARRVAEQLAGSEPASLGDALNKGPEREPTLQDLLGALERDVSRLERHVERANNAI